MKRITHKIFALGITMFMLKPSLLNVLPALLATIFGSLFPDFDIRFKHRRFLHNVFALTFIGILPLIMLENFFEVPSYISLMSKAFFIGYFTHIMLDLFSKGGVALFWPLRTRRYRVTEERYDNIYLNLFFSILGITAIIIYIKESILKIIFS